MLELLTIFAVTASTFIGTSLDNLISLVSLHTRHQDHPGFVSAGYMAGMLLILGICLLIGEVGELIPIAYLGLLGVIPIAVGCLALLRLFAKPGPRETDTGAVTRARSGAIFITLLTTQLSNSSDTIIAFSLLLADSTDFFDLQIIPVFMAMAGGFAWLARYLVNHQRLGDFLKRYGHYITPFILIMVGIYILSNTASDLVPGS